PFISALEQAYDSGVWASLDASSPRVNLSVTIPINNLSGFGVTAGSIVQWGELFYRVTSATVGSLNATLECTRHTTVADFDANWSGFTVAQH
ncbi:hypothetical protein OE165_27125, partial [Escherichia coli]|uniref:hypothetical protein n=1 Tax=Escherichia coli TaxID=562 RepID=UPI0021F2ED44